MRISGITSRFSATVIRATFVVLLAAAAMTLTPRAASADILVCDGPGPMWPVCVTLPGGCEIWNQMDDFDGTCWLVGTVAPAPNTYLIQDAIGGASVVIAGNKHTFIVPPTAGAASLTARWANRVRRGDSDRRERELFRVGLHELVRSSERRISDQNLQRLSGALKIPIRNADGSAGRTNAVPRQ